MISTLKKKTPWRLPQSLSVPRSGKVNIAVILLRHLSNFTDFNVLERDPRVHLFYTNNVDELAKADVILLPYPRAHLMTFTNCAVTVWRLPSPVLIRRCHRDGHLRWLSNDGAGGARP